MTDQTDAEFLREVVHNYLVAVSAAGWPEQARIVQEIYQPRLRAIAARLEAEEWRPIETAPKDGRDVMLWDSDLKQAIKAEWCDMADEWVPSDDGYLELTHWRPLPAPPADVKDAGDG